LRKYKSGNWILDDIYVKEEQISKLSKSLADGPWYIHLWQTGKDEIKIIFKNRIFEIKYSDKSTWEEAIKYGLSIGIPKEQLDFPIN